MLKFINWVIAHIATSDYLNEWTLQFPTWIVGGLRSLLNCIFCSPCFSSCWIRSCCPWKTNAEKWKMSHSRRSGPSKADPRWWGSPWASDGHFSETTAAVRCWAEDVDVNKTREDTHTHTHKKKLCTIEGTSGATSLQLLGFVASACHACCSPPLPLWPA